MKQLAYSLSRDNNLVLFYLWWWEIRLKREIVCKYFVQDCRWFVILLLCGLEEQNKKILYLWRSNMAQKPSKSFDNGGLFIIFSFAIRGNPVLSPIPWLWQCYLLLYQIIFSIFPLRSWYLCTLDIDKKIIHF